MSEVYDVVIIGSGLGGLQCGYILSKEGYKVCILEKNRQYGGCLQIFSRDKAIFDTGVHYIGGLEPGQNLHRYWSYFGLMDKLNLRRMDETGFDRISFGDNGKEYKHAMGYAGFTESLVEQFPSEREGIEKYVAKIKEVCNHFPLYNLKPRDLSGFDMTHFGVSARLFIESCTDDVRLQNVLAGSNALYAGYGDETPLYVHALVINTFIESSYKCIDGGGQITRGMESALKSMGCDMLNYAKVERMLFDGSEANGVELSDGRVIHGKKFISNIHPKATMNLIEEGKLRKSYRNRMTSLQNSLSVFTVHIVFKPETFPYLNYNIYHHCDQDTWSSVNYTKDNWPPSMAIFVPAESRSEKYSSCMNVMAYMNYAETAQWHDTFNTVPKQKSERSQEYQDWKLEKAEKIIDLLETKFPDVRSKIKSYYTSTPLSFRDYIGTEDGSLYGVKKDYKDPLKTYISPKTKVPNLFLTGQNLNMHGMLGVTVSSVVTCGEFMDSNYLLDKITSAS